MSEIITSENCDNLLPITPELKIKVAKDQKDHFELIVCPERTYLIVTAIHRDKLRNSIKKISCKKGIPIGGYVFDAQNDAYCFDCCDYLHLGYVSASLMLSVAGTGWQIRTPMSESVLRKLMTTLQKKELKNFKNHFKAEEYRLEFVQMVEPN